MIENDLIFFETKIKVKINFYKFTGGDLDHLKDQVQLKDLDLFHQDQLILNNPAHHEVQRATTHRVRGREALRSYLYGVYSLGRVKKLPLVR